MDWFFDLSPMNQIWVSIGATLSLLLLILITVKGWWGYILMGVLEILAEILD